MGEVFQALDAETGRLVAIKVLHDANDRDRFEQEARALSELYHPAIVRPVAYGATSGGAPYLAMEWLEGEDLASLLRRRRLGADEAIRLTCRIASALGEAHSRGLIHRDIKPANLFIERDDVSQARLLDFGIARFQGQARLTRTNAPLGTPGYMAPEQARGDPELTPAMDIFSLGCVLFEVLAGRPAFEGQHMMAILAKLIFMEAPPLEASRPDLAPELASLVARMLAKEPASRPQDGMALLVELTALEALLAPGMAQERTPVPVPPPGSLTEHEQRMVSVVMMGPGKPGGQDAEAWTLPPEVWRIAQEAGGNQERLADGSITVTFGGPGIVKDQVTLASRFALALRGHDPEVPIALATGRGATRKDSALGEALERAAQRIALHDAHGPGPFPVAIDSTTAALLDPRFEWREGTQGPELWGERDQPGTARTLLGKPTPYVGRDIELRMFEQAFDTCVEEPSAQVFLVTAPAGMGKSRLAREFINFIRGRAPEAAIWQGRADSSRAGSSLHLLGHALRGALGLHGSTSLEVQREKLRARFGGPQAPPDTLRLCEFLGELVGVPFLEPSSPQLAAARQDPQLMAEQLQRTFEEFLLAECATRPVVLIFDDLHWGDAASLRFVDQALQQARLRPVFVLGLARPEVHSRFPRLWSRHSPQEIRLRSLSARASQRLVRSVLGEALTEPELERLVARSEGNAFYLEELIRAVAEGQSALPDTVVGMVQSRLAALEPDARRVLRAASVYGEVFWRSATVALLGGMRTNQALDWLLLLVQREVLVRRPESRFPGEEEFSFRHALLREGAYALLTEEDRVLGHRLAGEWLEQHGEGDALALAEHFEKGKELERAAWLYVRAVDRAAEADDSEAILFCTERGLHCCNSHGEQRGALLSLKASVHVARAQYTEAIALSSEALDLLPAGSRRWYMTFHHLLPAVAFTQPAAFMDCARRFLDVPPNPEARVEYIRAGSWLFAMLEVTGAKDIAHSLYLRIQQESTHLDPNDSSAWAYVWGCNASHWHLAENAPWRCMQSNAEAVHRYERSELWRQRIIVGAHQGKALTDLGDSAGAEAVLRENLQVAERRGEAMPLTYARTYLARNQAIALPVDRLGEAEELARAAIAGENQSLLGPAHGALATIALRRGELEAAEAEARTACEWVKPFPTYSWDLVALRARILLSMGRVQEALSLSEETLRQFEHIGMTGQGEIDLRLAVAEAREAAGQSEAAREMLQLTLPRLRVRMEDIPSAEARARYLTQVRAHARLLELAREKLGREAVRAEGLEIAD
ncbi:hypothetical protein DB31_7370 [Hyalangium minutum]|uniref:Protein kinase domain-containing protein n=2 Tax=Hyalangium minutum TaxID=394096 RepID=A0A085WKC0_9BACT|nr:hypothetical protein DB31_7370 [Hyalangium minutum]